MNNNGQHTIATNAPFSLARRTTTDRPAARSRSPSPPPAHPSARGRGTNSSRQSDESRGEEAGREMEEGRRWIRAVVLVHILVVAPSRRRFIPSPLSSHLLSRPVVARLVVSSVIRSVCRFHLLVAIRFVVVPPLVSSSPRSSFVGSFPLPVFSTRWAGRFLIRWRAGKQARGRAGGVRAMDWAERGERGAWRPCDGRGKQAGGGQI